MTSFCLIAPATALRSYAQEGGGSTLEGLIKDDSGPLLGATVIVKNTTRGTTTDMDGKFRLEGLQPGDVLQVTYVGYDSPMLPKRSAAMTWPTSSRSI